MSGKVIVVDIEVKALRPRKAHPKAKFQAVASWDDGEIEWVGETEEDALSWAQAEALEDIAATIRSGDQVDAIVFRVKE